MYVVSYTTPVGDTADEFFSSYEEAVAHAKRCDGVVFKEDDNEITRITAA